MSVTVLCLLTFCGRSSSLVSLSWNGRGRTGVDEAEAGKVPRTRYPFMAYVIGDDALGCSGTIVSLTAVITTATCIVGDKKMKIWAGTNRLLKRGDFQPPAQYRSVTKVDVYMYSEIETHDIGIATVDPGFRRTRYVRPVPFWIQMPLLKFEYMEPVRVIGWGFGGKNITDKVLRSHFIIIGTSVMCPVTYLQLQRQIMCSNAGMYQGVCRGDEGGAVIANYPLLGFVLMAVVKGKVPAARVTEPPERVMDPTCGVPTGASMYTFVGYYRQWLLENIPEARIYEYWKPYLGNSTVYGNSIQSGNSTVKGTQMWKQGLELRDESTGSTGAMALMSLRLFVMALCLLLLPTERCGWQSVSAM